MKRRIKKDIVLILLGVAIVAIPFAPQKRPGRDAPEHGDL